MGTAEGSLEFPEIVSISYNSLSILYHDIMVKEKCMLKSTQMLLQNFTLLDLALWMDPINQRNQPKFRKVIVLFEIGQWVCHSWTICQIVCPRVAPAHPYLSPHLHIISAKREISLFFLCTFFPLYHFFALWSCLWPQQDTTWASSQMWCCCAYCCFLASEQRRKWLMTLHIWQRKKGSYLSEWQD